ncbi:hypothetical protein AURDEDRAFT_111950 [Auricularia subglabra TFB-10046 SS5]|nr:hypothetical protein AURDEDRAFT_111950 [Auricularia subglabra TFB-10046 SS5]
MTTTSYKGIKLDPNNFFEWQNSALAHIMSRGVYEYIEHPSGLRPQATAPTRTEQLAAKAAALAAGGLETTITAPATSTATAQPTAAAAPAQAAAAAPAAPAGTANVTTWVVAVPNTVSRRVQSVTLVPSPCTAAEYKDWCKQARIACGTIWDTLGPTIQKDENVGYLMRSGDPFLLWAAIFRKVNPTTPSSRFSAMTSLLSIVWQDGWDLEDGHAAVSELFNRYLDTRSPGMSADDVLNEVALYAYLRIVPPELDTFSTTIFIAAGDSSLALPDLTRVLQQEDSKQEIRGKPLQTEYRARLAREIAARAQVQRALQSPASPTPGAATKLSYRDALAALQASRPQWKKCWLCAGDHLLDTCQYIGRAQRHAKDVREGKADDHRQQQTANAASEATNAATDDRFPEIPNVAPLT